MSVAMTNCGRVGWVSDRTGYRYDPVDPDTGTPWPAMPAAFLDLAVRAAAEAGFARLRSRRVPDQPLRRGREAQPPSGPRRERCLGARSSPSRSALPAVFLWGGKRRSDPVRRLRLESGDVVVWGGPARFVYHGVAPLKDGEHPLTGAARINLTFRKVF